MQRNNAVSLLLHSVFLNNTVQKHTVALPWRRIQYLYWQHVYLNNTENN